MSGTRSKSTSTNSRLGKPNPRCPNRANHCAIRLSAEPTTLPQKCDIPPGPMRSRPAITANARKPLLHGALRNCGDFDTIENQAGYF
jgi:hypothetical protein